MNKYLYFKSVTTSSHTIKRVRYTNAAKSRTCICNFNTVWCIMFDHTFKRTTLIYFTRCIPIANVYVKRSIFNIMIHDFKKLMKSHAGEIIIAKKPYQ